MVFTKTFIKSKVSLRPTFGEELELIDEDDGELGCWQSRKERGLNIIDLDEMFYVLLVRWVLNWH
jgi:hypothetical protein